MEDRDGLMTERTYHQATMKWWTDVLGERAETGGPMTQAEWALLEAFSHIRELLSAPAAPRERTPEEHRAAKIAALRMELGSGVSETTNSSLTEEDFEEKTIQLRGLEAQQSNERWRANMENAWAALRMIRETLEQSSPGILPSEEAVLKLHGPEPVHEATVLVEAIQTVTDERDQWRDEALRFKAYADRAEEELAARPVWDARRREWMARYLAATLASGGPNDRLFKVDLPKWIQDVHDAFEDVGTVALAPSTSGGK